MKKCTCILITYILTPPVLYATTISTEIADTSTYTTNIPTNIVNGWIKCEVGNNLGDVYWGLGSSPTYNKGKLTCGSGKELQTDFSGNYYKTIYFKYTCTSTTTQTCGAVTLAGGFSGSSRDWEIPIAALTVNGTTATAKIPDVIELGTGKPGDTKTITAPITLSQEGTNVKIGMGLATNGHLDIRLSDVNGEQDKKGHLWVTGENGVITSDGGGLDFKKSGNIILEWLCGDPGVYKGTLTFILTPS